MSSGVPGAADPWIGAVRCCFAGTWHSVNADAATRYRTDSPHRKLSSGDSVWPASGGLDSAGAGWGFSCSSWNARRCSLVVALGAGIACPGSCSCSSSTTASVDRLSSRFGKLCSGSSSSRVLRWAATDRCAGLTGQAACGGPPSSAHGSGACRALNRPLNPSNPTGTHPVAQMRAGQMAVALRMVALDPLVPQRRLLGLGRRLQPHGGELGQRQGGIFTLANRKC